jgi:RNA polymerase primary sigma factor
MGNLVLDNDIDEIDALVEEDEIEDIDSITQEDLVEVNKKSDSDNLLNLYLKEIAPIPLLTKDEEIRYGKMVKAGQQIEDIISKMESELGHIPSLEQISKKLSISVEEIRKIKKEAALGSNKLITSNLRLVVSIAKKYKEKGLSFDDLIQEGNLGLMRAVEKFDPAKGYKFSTYATWWIRQAISRGLSIKSRTIRLPLHIVEATQKIKKAIRKMTQENGKRPDTESLAKELDMPIEKLRTISKASIEPISIDTKLKGDDDVYVKDLIPGFGETPEELLIKESMKEKIENLLEILTEKEREMIMMRFGLDDGQQKSLQDIADQFDLTRERVRQIINMAMKKLRNPEKLKSLVGFLDN